MEAVIESKVVEARETGPRRNRDRELLRYVGRHGVVRIGQVMVAMDAGRSVLGLSDLSCGLDRDPFAGLRD